MPYDPAAHVWTPSAAEVAWARAHARPLADGPPAADLDALRPLLAGARVVALGESTHGTREIFTTKDRLIRWMVEHAGATVVAFEASMPEARRINEYVLTGRGDPRAALAGVFWTWNTEEVLALVEWLRAYNASGRGRVEFWGFDLQTPTVAADSVRAFVARADPAFLPAVDSAYAVVSAAFAETSGGAQVSPARIRAWGEAASRVSAHLARRRADYLARFDTLEVDWAEQNARIVEQGAAMRLPGGVPRDSSMALNLAWIAARGPAADRVVAWAHNSHVERAPGSMGGSLDRRFGDAYRVIGFAIGEGDYTAMGPRGLAAYPAPAAPAGTVENALSRVGLPRFVLDLRAARADSGGAWLLEPRPFRWVGFAATDDQFRELPVASRFDGLIYLDRTTASRLLPRAGR